MEKQSQREYWNGPAAEAWTRHADRVDAVIAPLGDAAMEALDPRPGERVLDIGCGAGATTRALAAHVAPGGVALGVDLSGPLVALARARGGGPLYMVADAGEADLPAPADALFSRFGVMFFEDPVRAFGNLARAVRHGGRMAFVCWRPLHENLWAREPLEATLALLREPPAPPAPDAPGPFSLGDPARVRRILSEAGFGAVEVAPLDRPYRIAADAQTAAEMSLTFGPLASAVRAQGLDPEPLRAPLRALWERHRGQDGVSVPAACWLVTAERG